ncbi:MAG TPA: hypothetical protein VJU86_20890 [Pyrinomonadaceae bacterium]|nr:hypothetical protein [Pyrinomonadaceae bacterium]
MKSCPKCNRTYPDDHQKFCTFDGGLLIAASPGFDPNATIASTRLGSSEETIIADPSSDLTATRDLSATIASRSAPTAGVSKPTGPTGFETMFEKAPPRPAPPLPTAAVSGPAVPVVTEPPKKSKLPLILGGLALLLLLGAGAIAAIFVLVIKPKLDEEQAERPVVTQPNKNANVATNENVKPSPEPSQVAEYVPPPNTVRFANSSSNLDGKLADHYFDFSFYYPDAWQTDPKAGVPGASNFVKVERRLPPDFTQENFAVGWYTSRGTYEADESTFPQLVEILSASLARGFPEYRKVSEGPTKVNSMDAYEFRFESVSKGTEKGDLDLWGRVIFLPTGVSGESTGATLILLATSLAPEVSGVENVGVTGQMPVVLESFRFGKKP